MMIWRCDRIVLFWWAWYINDLTYQSETSPGPGNHNKSSIKTQLNVSTWIASAVSGLHDMASASAEGVAQKIQPSAFFEMQDWKCGEMWRGMRHQNLIEGFTESSAVVSWCFKLFVLQYEGQGHSTWFWKTFWHHSRLARKGKTVLKFTVTHSYQYFKIGKVFSGNPQSSSSIHISKCSLSTGFGSSSGHSWQWSEWKNHRWCPC